VISPGPTNGTANAAFALSVRLNLEVPNASSGSNDELADAHNECIHPEQHEDLVEDNIAGVVFPLDVGNEGVVFTRHGLSNREYVNETHEPDGHPGANHEVGSKGKEVNMQVR